MIKITIAESKKVYGDESCFASFPYDNELIGLIRSYPDRFWHAESKTWEFAVKNLPAFLNDVSGHEIEICGSNQPRLAQGLVSDAVASFKFKTKPFNHQLEGFQYGLKNDRFLLGDEQGLGKTKQVIDIAIAKKQSKGYKHCLIVCGVNGLKWNWQAEIAVHSDEDSFILGTRVNSKGVVRIGSSADKLEDLENLPDAYFIITNVESLRNKEICLKVAELCTNNIINMVAIDEIHKCKNPQSQQGKAIMKVLPETRIAMTGTPLMNSPLDLFIVVKWLGFEKHSFWQFKNHYCSFGGYGGYEIVGYKNMGELHEHFKDVVLRRLKKDVLDLPEKIHTTEYVEMTPGQSKIYNEVKADLLENIDKVLVNPNPLAQLIRLRQATGYTGILSSEIQESAKLDRLEELVEELVENNEKCLIFSNWTDMTAPAFERLQRFNPAIITGETKDRVGEQDRFTNDPNCKCIIGTTGAMGTGLTLTAGTTVIFLDSPWNRALKEQAEDRVHRIGTTSTINIITLVCKGTIDERIEDLVTKKGHIADALVDGKLEKNRSDVVNFLLN